jgi:glucose-6-phosphate dehydrogenase assembly protein OpcA
MPALVNPEEILHNLHDLWDEMDRQQSGSGGILRACALTLVVTAEDEQDAENVRRLLGILMHDHPSRAVIVRNSTAPGQELEARVFAECWKPFGSAQQICSEGVEITSLASQLSDVAGLLVPLRVPDLPLVLWCRGPRAFTRGVFEPLYSLADKIVVDSAPSPDAKAALDFLRGLRATGYRVGDLHWTRLTGWREILASLFDQAALKPGDISEVRIEHGGEQPSTCARYFAAWIGTALPRARLSLQTQPGRGGVRSLTLSGSTGTITLTHIGPSVVEVNGLGRSYRCTLPPTDEASLMSEELKILGTDLVYERVLQS